MKQIIAYTDGSASVAGKLAGQGGFGTYFPDLFGRKVAYSLGFKKAKTGQMEVLALLYAIRAMPKSCLYPITLVVFSDSEYVVKTFTENRLIRWESNNWINSSGEVKNKELWIKLLKELRERSYMRISLNHIKSHQVDRAKTKEGKELLMKDVNIVGNLMVDKLADYKRHTKLIPDITYIK